MLHLRRKAEIQLLSSCPSTSEREGAHSTLFDVLSGGESEGEMEQSGGRGGGGSKLVAYVQERLRQICRLTQLEKDARAYLN